MATARQWIDGARPRTLPAALAPVIAGTAVGVFERGGSLTVVRALLALLVALALQVGVNYSNDYSDGIRGTDQARVGPVRLVGQALATPQQVKRAALLSFLVAAVAGLALVVLTHAWWLLIVGALAIAAAWLYTGGPRPYGYAGLGEVFVFVFFGLVATMGSAYVQTGTLTWLSLASAVAGVLWLVGIRSNPLILVALALVISGFISLIALNRTRDAASVSVSSALSRMNDRIESSARAEDDLTEEPPPSST